MSCAFDTLATACNHYKGKQLEMQVFKSRVVDAIGSAEMVGFVAMPLSTNYPELW